MFGWYVQAGPPEAGGYAMCLKDDRPVAGIGPKQGPPGTPAAWTTYLASDDLDETVSKIKASGGLVLMEPMDVMDVGRMGVAADPGGAVFGIWQAQARGPPGGRQARLLIRPGPAPPRPSAGRRSGPQSAAPTGRWSPAHGSARSGRSR